MALNATKNSEKAGSLYAMHHGFHQQVADKKTKPKKELEMKYVKTILCMLATTPRSICLWINSLQMKSMLYEEDEIPSLIPC